MFTNFSILLLSRSPYFWKPNDPHFFHSRDSSTTKIIRNVKYRFIQDMRHVFKDHV